MSLIRIHLIKRDERINTYNIENYQNDDLLTQEQIEKNEKSQNHKTFPKNDGKNSSI